MKGVPQLKVLRLVLSTSNIALVPCGIDALQVDILTLSRIMRGKSPNLPVGRLQ